MNESLPQKATTLASHIQHHNPSSVYANLLLAKVYLGIPTGMKQAELVLRKCYAMNSGDEEVVYLLAKVLYEKGDFKGAVDMFYLMLYIE